MNKLKIATWIDKWASPHAPIGLVENKTDRIKNETLRSVIEYLIVIPLILIWTIVFFWWWGPLFLVKIFLDE